MSPRIKKQQENICSTTLHHGKRDYKAILAGWSSSNNDKRTWVYLVILQFVRYDFELLGEEEKTIQYVKFKQKKLSCS